ncbi:DUF309 domain-containing protein [Bradyrhizobium erythrophlei]|jgi:hypothetical protein|uniref:DUF309 domain-containing protein n=1 Tax=Bradyrhizobium erythrophlei TaxID=1437360 RepID=A0A1M5GXN4_9BRAD|nr:DUF309 domain-containing protein [Bradyrhizobium erythrophlei]SHG08232.1 hypothetical protein SAMN05443248_0217 [Bradyrhizobium erythrophlei]
MSIPPSTAVSLPLPRWAYVPGETADAEADHDTLWQAKALVPSRFRGFVPARHPALRYGIALNDSGYFWESQEVLEAVWAAAPQGGRERMLLRACIQIANANLRLRMQKPRAAVRLLREALGELAALGARQTSADGFADGFPSAALAALLRDKLALPALSMSDWVKIGVAWRA